MDRLSHEQCIEIIQKQAFNFAPKNYHTQYPIWPGRVGIEFEMLPVKQSSTHPSKLEPIPLWNLNNQASLSQTLTRLSQTQDWEPRYDKEKVTSFKTGTNEQITFEPGGQFEFSTIPYPCLADAVSRVNKIQSAIHNQFQKQNWKSFQIGVNPWHSVDTIGLQMNKPRYIAMNKHFLKISKFGQSMMRQTLTVQVCQDFGHNEETLVKRYLGSMLIAPIAAAIFANSRYLNCQDSGRDGYRILTWRHLDPSRTGFPKIAPILKNLTLKSCVESYLDYALNASIIYLPRPGFPTPRIKATMHQWINEGIDGDFATESDFSEYLTLLFPEVRPKGFIEHRSIDAQATIWQFVPAAFYCGLLYHTPTLDRCIERLINFAPHLETFMEHASFGLSHPELNKASRDIFKMAIEGFESLPSCFRGAGINQAMLKFYENFTYQGRVPSSDIKREVDKSELHYPTDLILEKVEAKWQKIVDS